jgi:hypothetical protein
MSRTEKAALALAGFRVAYGLALAAKPAAVTKSWIGPGAAAAPSEVPLRGMGGREIAVHTALAAAVLADAPVKPWLAVSIAGDCTDVAATYRAGDGLPDGSPVKTLVVAGLSAALSAAVLVALDR